MEPYHQQSIHKETHKCAYGKKDMQGHTSEQSINKYDRTKCTQRNIGDVQKWKEGGKEVEAELEGYLNSWLEEMRGREEWHK